MGVEPIMSDSQFSVGDRREDGAVCVAACSCGFCWSVFVAAKPAFYWSIVEGPPNVRGKAAAISCAGMTIAAAIDDYYKTDPTALYDMDRELDNIDRELGANE